MKKIVILLLLSVFILSCGKKEEFLTIGANDMFPPFVYIGDNGYEMVGFDIEFAKEIAKAQGLELKVINMSFDQLIPSVENGTIDMAICSITITEARGEIIDFSDPYYEASQVALVRKEDFSLFEHIVTKEELGASKKLAAQIGTTGAAIARLIANGNDVLELDTWGQALVELSSGKVDAAIIDRESARTFASQYSNLVALDIRFPTESYGIGIKKGNSKLLKAANDTIANLIISGRYNELVQKYIEEHTK